jgi:hypothetical protein
VSRLYDLLPAVYRRRDAEEGFPLRALLAVVGEQADIVEDDIRRLYENWFIETCQDWVVPYLGDLVGYQRPDATGAASRAEVANTLANRRRKGTLALLEKLAADVAGWPARAVEFRKLLGVTQAIRLYGGDARADARRLRRGRLVDLHAVDALDRVDGPFDELAHSIDVSGRHNIPNVGLYVWRLRAYSITHAPAHCDDRARSHFTFSILGNDTPLMAKPVAEPTPTHIADETNVPAFIRRRAFADRLAHYYGKGKSLAIFLEGEEPVPLSHIVAADLTDWRYNPKPGQVAVDPVLGRIAFPSRRPPESGVWVSYHYGFSDDMGGGEYRRQLARPSALYTVGPGGMFELIMDAYRAWRADRTGDPDSFQDAVIELTDSGEYQERIELRLDRGEKLTLRAAQGARPLIRLLDQSSNRPDAMRITGAGAGTGPLPTVVLDGLLVAGRSVRVHGEIGQVVVRHSTLVPGWTIDEHCRPEHEEEASIELSDTPACLQVERSILGTILVNESEVHTEPNPIWLSDSILDSAGRRLAAVIGPNDRHAHAVFNARRTTVFGSVHVHAVGLVENSILDGDVRVARRQTGCVRFSWLPPGSRTPARFHCEPEHSGDPDHVVPFFTSTRYGTPGYAQLASFVADEIRRGAEDGSEMGAFHELHQPQREDTLRQRLAEHTSAGSDPVLIIVT